MEIFLLSRLNISNYKNKITKVCTLKISIFILISKIVVMTLEKLYTWIKNLQKL